VLLRRYPGYTLRTLLAEDWELALMLYADDDAQGGEYGQPY
jgi:hypothetical protein